VVAAVVVTAVVVTAVVATEIMGRVAATEGKVMRAEKRMASALIMMAAVPSEVHVT
jgi:hypothetical protein